MNLNLSPIRYNLLSVSSSRQAEIFLTGNIIQIIRQKYNTNQHSGHFHGEEWRETAPKATYVTLHPPSCLPGAAIGGIYSWKTSDDFKPLPQILREMPPAQLDELLKSVMAILVHLKWETVEGLIDYVMKDIPLKKAIIDELKRRVKTLTWEQVCREFWLPADFSWQSGLCE